MNKDTTNLQEKLDAINKAMAEANGDTKKQLKIMETMVDPQDSLNCEGCQ